jgi:hypothetical protein
MPTKDAIIPATTEGGEIFRLEALSLKNREETNTYRASWARYCMGVGDISFQIPDRKSAVTPIRYTTAIAHAVCESGIESVGK